MINFGTQELSLSDNNKGLAYLNRFSPWRSACDALNFSYDRNEKYKAPL